MNTTDGKKTKNKIRINKNNIYLLYKNIIVYIIFRYIYLNIDR